MFNKSKYNETERELLKEAAKGKRRVALVAVFTFLVQCVSLIITFYGVFSGRITTDYDNFGYNNPLAPVLTFGILFTFTIIGTVLSFMLMKALINGKKFSRILFYIFQLVYFFYFMIYMFNFYPKDETKLIAIFYLIFFIICICLMFLMKGEEQSKFFEKMNVINTNRNHSTETGNDENQE